MSRVPKGGKRIRYKQVGTPNSTLGTRLEGPGLLPSSSPPFVTSRTRNTQSYRFPSFFHSTIPRVRYPCSREVLTWTEDFDPVTVHRPHTGTETESVPVRSWDDSNVEGDDSVEVTFGVRPWNRVTYSTKVFTEGEGRDVGWSRRRDTTPSNTSRLP